MTRLFAILTCAATLATAQSDISDRLSRAIRGESTGAPHALPAGFSIAAKSGDVGQAIAGPVSGVNSRAAFQAMLRQVSPYFDHAPGLQAAFADPKNMQIQALFKASYQGTPVRGLMIVTAQNGSGTGAILFDRENLFAKSVGALSKQMAAAAPKGTPAPAGPAQLTRTPLPDGSGFIGLPPGWRVLDSYKGALDVAGPDQQSMSLGIAHQVFRQGRPGGALIIGPYRPPWPAWQLFVDFANRGALSRGEMSMRLLEQSPEQSPAGQAEWLAYEASIRGAKRKGLAYVITKPFNDDIGTWFLYTSFIGAPAERWAQDLPTMWAIWKSWSINPSVFRECMDAALRSMRETTQIIQDMNRSRSHAFDNANYGWDECIRGVTMIEDIESHERAEVDTNHVDWWLEQFNRRGYNVRKVPLADLVP